MIGLGTIINCAAIVAGGLVGLAGGRFMTDTMLNAISMTGGILIFCIGFNLMWPKMIKVANLLPALVITVIITML